MSKNLLPCHIWQAVCNLAMGSTNHSHSILAKLLVKTLCIAHRLH